MTEIPEKYRDKTSRAWLEIDTGALRKNISIIKDRTGCRKLMAVIKADAYGHGAVGVATAVSDAVDMFGVAAPHEAAELRRAGIRNDILVLGVSMPESIPGMLENFVTPTVFDLDTARDVSEAAKKLGMRAGMFVAVDTGMERIGVTPDAAGAETVRKISLLENTEIKGIFTHLARADEKDKESASGQIEKFRSFTVMLEKLGIDYGATSISNSAAAIDMDVPQDIVRAGIVIYGVAPSDEVALPRGIRPVLSMKARVEQVKTVPAGVGVSYGHTYVTERETVIATVCCGYADGVPRALSNKGCVLVNGRRAPIVGRVCMDQLMADVTGAGQVKKGDIVTVIGVDGDETVTVDEIAGISGTIPYEILTGLSTPRVPKIYI